MRRERDRGVSHCGPLPAPRSSADGDRRHARREGEHVADRHVGGSSASPDGLGRTLPLDTVSHGAIVLSSTSARAIGASNSGAGARAMLIVGGVKRRVRVSDVLDREVVGALSGALVGVMPPEDLQGMLGLVELRVELVRPVGEPPERPGTPWELSRSVLSPLQVDLASLILFAASGGVVLGVLGEPAE